jgi:hypothetical protein
MNDLDRLLENSMSALRARNEFVFESSRQHMHSVIKGGSPMWPWVTVLSTVAVIGISLIAFQQTRVNPIRVSVPDVQKSFHIQDPKAPVEKLLPVTIPPFTNAEVKSEAPAHRRVVTVPDADKELAHLFTTQTAYAESASQRGDHLLAAITYRDLARTCQLNNDKSLAWKAIQMALGEARYVNNVSLINEIELLAESIAK